MTQVFASTTCIGPGRTRLEDAVASLTGLGLDGLELGSTHIHESDLAGTVRKCGTRLLSHNYFPPSPVDLVINLASPDPGVRDASISHAAYCIEFAGDCGVELYTVHPGFMAVEATTSSSHQGETAYDFEFAGGGVPHEEAFSRMLDALERLLRVAQRSRIRLAIETEGSMTKPGILLMERPEEYRRLHSALGDSLGLNLNLAHSRFAARHHGHDLGEFLAEVQGRIAAVELSHNDGYRDLHAPLTEDSYVFDWLGRLPDVPLILEFRDAPPPLIARCAQLLRRANEHRPKET